MPQSATKRNAVLTPKQREMLAYVIGHQKRHGMPPTTQEAADHFAITFGPAYRLIEQVIRKGYLRRRAKVARGLKVLRHPDGVL